MKNWLLVIACFALPPIALAIIMSLWIAYCDYRARRDDDADTTH